MTVTRRRDRDVERNGGKSNADGDECSGSCAKDNTPDVEHHASELALDAQDRHYSPDGGVSSSVPSLKGSDGPSERSSRKDTPAHTTTRPT